MHSDFNNIKISDNLKERIKAEYKEEKKKPKYKIRKALNYEIEVPKVVVAVVLVTAIMTPVIESVNKVRDLTYYKIETGEYLENEKGQREEYIGKNNKTKD